MTSLISQSLTTRPLSSTRSASTSFKPSIRHSRLWNSKASKKVSLQSASMTRLTPGPLRIYTRTKIDSNRFSLTCCQMHSSSQSRTELSMFNWRSQRLMKLKNHPRPREEAVVTRISRGQWPNCWLCKHTIMSSRSTLSTLPSKSLTMGTASPRRARQNSSRSSRC